MLNNITFFMILGKPLLFWLGILGMLLLIATIMTAVLPKKGVRIPVKYHVGFAIATFAVGLIHGLLSILSSF